MNLELCDWCGRGVLNIELHKFLVCPEKIKYESASRKWARLIWERHVGPLDEIKYGHGLDILEQDLLAFFKEKSAEEEP